MCGRYTIGTDAEALAARFDVQNGTGKGAECQGLHNMRFREGARICVSRR